MSKAALNIALAVLGDADWEARAIRTVLEGFNARVFWYPIGRPNDLVRVLNGDDLYPDTNDMILSCHGINSKIAMPKLGREAYEPHEPRQNFGAKEIKKYACLSGKHLLNSGCGLGNDPLASAFLTAGCESYIGAIGDVEGNAALFFVIRYYYERIENKRTRDEAYKLAASTDRETQLFKCYNTSQAV